MHLPNGRARRLLAASDGTSLVDALVAAALVVVFTAGVAHLLVWARRAAWSAGSKTLSVVLAAEKLERLRALKWEADPGGTPVSDAQTDLSADVPRGGGRGLAASPAGTLAANSAGFVDYLDAGGRWLGTGIRPPTGAAFVRRWAIEPFAVDAAHTLVLTVVVLPVSDAASGATYVRERGVRLSTIRTRVLR